MLDRRQLLAAGLTLPLSPALAGPATARETRSFETILAAARGQTVYWNAWGGDPATNDFIAWVGQEARRQFGVTINHVKLRDTAEAVTRVLGERQAGRLSGGTVDLIWINGPNFLAMKTQGLLHGPFVEVLPHWPLVDTVNIPSNTVDFTVPVEGMASPWRRAQIVFVHDSARSPRASLPRSMAAMVPWAAAHPGRLAHPQVRNFLGATFLKQALIELTPDRAMLAAPATDASFEAATAPLWPWYRALRPHLWRQGREFPETGAAARTLLNDGEIDLTLSFNPAEAAAGAIAGTLPQTARVFTLDGGTIGNTSFVAIPFNAAHKEGAMVIANFLLAPATQARAQDPRHMGNLPVLDLARLSPADQALFRTGERHPAMPHGEDLGPPLPEPHPSWMTRITAAWETLSTR